MEPAILFIVSILSVPVSWSSNLVHLQLYKVKFIIILLSLHG